MRRSPLAALWVLVLLSAALCAAQPAQSPLLWDHGSHTEPSAGERALREVLARYSAGDVEGAVRAVLTSTRWVPAALDATLRRTEEEIEHHRRPANRVGVAADERLERYLRADRVNVLALSAAVQLEASRAATDVDTAGRHILGSERAIDALFALRGDFERNGPVPWPIAVNERWDVERDARASADWPVVRAFVARWYPAAVSRLQALVEVSLAPQLVSRGLSRFPEDPDLLLARGSLAETRLMTAQVDASMASMLYPSDVRLRWQNQLSGAEEDFERAAREAGPSSEAAVRLARVRLLKGQPDRARQQLDQVLAAEPRGDIRYLALLFRAAIAEQSGAADAAVRDYEAAARILPGAQTPMLALARLADERGGSAEARTWVARALTERSGSADPWRVYIQGQASQVGDRISRLRTLEPH